MKTLSKQLHSINEIQSAQQTDVIFPNKLNPEVVTLLNQRLEDEYTAHYFYRNASNWCNDKAYLKAGAFFAAEAASELTHAEKLQSYMVGWNVTPFIPPVKMIPSFTTLIDIVNKMENISKLYMGRYFGIETNDKRLKVTGKVKCYVSVKKSADRIMYLDKYETDIQHEPGCVRNY